MLWNVGDVLHAVANLSVIVQEFISASMLCTETDGLEHIYHVGVDFDCLWYSGFLLFFQFGPQASFPSLDRALARQLWIYGQDRGEQRHMSH